MKTTEFINKLTGSKHVRHRVILAVLFAELFSLIFWGFLPIRVQEKNYQIP